MTFIDRVEHREGKIFAIIKEGDQEYELAPFDVEDATWVLHSFTLARRQAILYNKTAKENERLRIKKEISDLEQKLNALGE
jgi:hypothetical protein